MKNIVLCGSVKLKDELIKVGDMLIEKGYNVLLPLECFQELPKEIASFKHFERIEDKENDTVLIVNGKKNNIENYIGPNTFAEIAFAFYFHKNVYLLYDIYEPYKDELLGWKVKTLKGDLSKLK